MKARTTKLVLSAGVLLLPLLICELLRAQVGGAQLSGTVTGPSGAVVRNATVCQEFAHRSD